MLEIKNLSKKFHNNYILKDINLTLKPGTVSILLGKSGVGKSTLLRVLNNLETIDFGTISYNGHPLDLQTIHDKHLIGMVFQNFSLFKNLTVQGNISLVLEKIIGLNKKDADQKTNELLCKFNLLEQASKKISMLSGGQQQRLAIARALAVNPKILCMDEPTSALDPLLTKYVANVIGDIAKSGYAVLVTTHDMSLVENLECTIYLMEEGTIKETASSIEFKNNPEKFKFIYPFVHGKPSS
jgi:ABC-type polar amino acid transport system ATPase subunit